MTHSQKSEARVGKRGFRAAVVALTVLVPTFTTATAVLAPTAAHAGVNDDSV